MSDLKLVYRALRKISEWSLSFYSDVYVTGQQNIPEDGPVLLISCHHNEIIDIATLSVTIPFRRPVCFWAKSTLFRNPVTRAILLSSGSIPVHRSANTEAAATSNNGNGTKDVHLSLFRETFQAFDAGEVIGLFPEGTSYTEPEIVQVKDGAAWAALEYVRWQLQHAPAEEFKAKKLAVIPVGIVYTDKSRYQSRVRVEYGGPINIDAYTRLYLAATGTQDSRSVIRSLTTEIEKHLRRLTVNAPNWDTWFAARIFRDIAWGGDSKIPLRAYTEISQSYIDRLSAPDVTPSARETLVKYYALLQHTGLTHGTLATVLPLPRPSPAYNHGAPRPDPILTRRSALLLFVRHLLAALLHPSFALFLPPLILHLPVYAASALSVRLLASAGEEETRAQFQAVCGGMVYGVLAAVAGLRASKVLSAAAENSYLSGVRLPGLRGMLGTAAVVYCTVWGLFRWYNTLVHGNYVRYTRLRAAWTLLLGVLSPASHDSDDAPRPVLPARNPYVRRRPAGEAGTRDVDVQDAPNDDVRDTHNSGVQDTRDVGAQGKTKTPSAAAGTDATRLQAAVRGPRLVRRLLRARVEAEAVVRELNRNFKVAAA